MKSSLWKSTHVKRFGLVITSFVFLALVQALPHKPFLRETSTWVTLGRCGQEASWIVNYMPALVSDPQPAESPSLDKTAKEAKPS